MHKYCDNENQISKIKLCAILELSVFRAHFAGNFLLFTYPIKYYNILLYARVRVARTGIIETGTTSMKTRSMETFILVMYQIVSQHS